MKGYIDAPLKLKGAISSPNEFEGGPSVITAARKMQCQSEPLTLINFKSEPNMQGIYDGKDKLSTNTNNQIEMMGPIGDY